MKTIRLPSLLYSALFEEGGDKLVAVFCMLKAQRKKKEKYLAYKAKNNKWVGGKNLLRQRTTLSLHSLNKYLAPLLEMDLCWFDSNGDFCVLGNNKLKERFGAKKLVPILVSKKLTTTAWYSFNVRVHSNEDSQKRMIDKKQHQRELLVNRDNPKSLKEFKAAKRLIKKLGSVELPQLIDKVVLSNQGFGRIKEGTKVEDYSQHHKGRYAKEKLKELGAIKTRRQFTLIKRMSFGAYRLFKKNSGELKVNRYTYIQGHLAEETASKFWTTHNYMQEDDTLKEKVAHKKEGYKHLEYLSIDFIGWLEDNPKAKCTRD